MKQKIDINDGDLEYIMARVDRLTVALESFGRGSVSFCGFKIISWETGNE